MAWHTWLTGRTSALRQAWRDADKLYDEHMEYQRIQAERRAMQAAQITHYGQTHWRGEMLHPEDTTDGDLDSWGGVG